MAQVLDRVKLFLDTNVLLDILVKREGTVYAAAILEAAGSNLNKVVKTTIFVKDLKNFATINAAYAEFFQDALFRVGGQAHTGAGRHRLRRA